MLRSIEELYGYTIRATDGDIGKVHDFYTDDEIGHAEDFIVQDTGWVIRYMVVDTRNWLAGKKVLVATDWIEEVDWIEHKVHVNLERNSVEESPEFQPEMPVNQTYEQRLYDYYGRPAYWLDKQYS